ncbi:MAG: cell division protein SepF [Candidatus Anstonellales archaeon]
MGILDKIFGGQPKVEALENIDEVIEEEEVDAVTPPAKMYVKKIPLRNEGDADLAVKELGAGNIVIIDTTPIIKQPNRLKTLIDKIKTNAQKNNGDVAALVPSHELILVTPSGVRIVKAKKG